MPSPDCSGWGVFSFAYLTEDSFFRPGPSGAGNTLRGSYGAGNENLKNLSKKSYTLFYTLQDTARVKVKPLGQIEAKMKPAAQSRTGKAREARGSVQRRTCVTTPYALPGFPGVFPPNRHGTPENVDKSGKTGVQLWLF